MKFKKYLKKLNNLAKENPDALEMEVIAAKDDEGNGFNKVIYPPSVGLFENGEFKAKDGEENAVCLN